MIQLQQITKSYTMGDETIPVLKGINLTILSGEFVAIMWPSGSWKSTLMNIIGLLDTPTTGEYLLDGWAVQHLTWDDQSLIRSQKIWFVFQSYNLIARMPAIEQVALPLSYQWYSRSERNQRAKEALIRVGLEQKIYNKPNELSGWQQQRVSIARAIVTNPSVILADEPTGALDSKTGVEVMHLLSSLHQEWKTIILITHAPELAQWYAQRIVNIRDGLLV